MARKKSSDVPTFSKSQLADMFEISRNTVINRLRNVKPSGKSAAGYPEYTLKSVVHLLIDHAELDDTGPAPSEPDDPDKMAPELRKDYWDAKLKEQKYLKEEGDLWSSQEVIELFSGLFKPVSFGVRALSDVLERRLGMTPKQVEIIQEECDRVLEDVYNDIAEHATGLPNDIGHHDGRGAGPAAAEEDLGKRSRRAVS